MLLKAALAAAVVTLLPGPASAQAPAACQLKVDSSSINWTIQSFDPLDNGLPAALFDLTFRNEGSGDCTFVPVLALSGETFGLSKGGSGHIPYTVLDRFSNYDMTPVSGQTTLSVTRRSVVLGPGQQQTVQFQLSMDPDQLHADGLFTQHAVLQAMQADGLILAGQPVVLGIDLLPSARLGLSGAFTISGGRPVVDLGDLAEGPVQLPLRLRVQSTRRYRLSFESLHGGNLQLAESEWRIPYNVTLGSQTVLLTGGSGQYSDEGAASYHEDSLALGFVVGDTAARRAGVYSDVLTVTVEPQ